MKRGFRLSKPADFNRVRRSGKSLGHRFLSLVTLPNKLGKVRVAVSAGRAVGNAVSRNRAKRILRAAIKPFLADIKPGQDIVLIAREGIRERKSTDLHEVLKGLLKKAKLIDNQ